jgi:hypothetical protein
VNYRRPCAARAPKKLRKSLTERLDHEAKLRWDGHENVAPGPPFEVAHMTVAPPSIVDLIGIPQRSTTFGNDAKARGGPGAYPWALMGLMTMVVQAPAVSIL